MTMTFRLIVWIALLLDNFVETKRFLETRKRSDPRLFALDVS